MTAAPLVAPAAAAATAATPAAAAAAPSMAGLTRSLVWGPALTQLAANAPDLATAIVAGGKSPYDVGSSTSKYFTPQQLILEAQDREYRQSILQKILGLVGLGQDPISAAETIAQATEMRQAEAESLSKRELAKLALEANLNRALRSLELQNDLAKQNVITAGDIKRQELSSLGSIQQQRVESSYGAAEKFLNTAIQNLTTPQNIANSSVIQQLATQVA